jgi:hypothetical protein
MNDHKQVDLSNGIDACNASQLAFFTMQYDELIKRGYDVIFVMKDTFGSDELRRVIQRLDKHKDKHLRFMIDYDVPWDNNLAERDLRMDKTKQKISGCFRSWLGLENHATARSFISTLKKRGFDLADFRS